MSSPNYMDRCVVDVDLSGKPLGTASFHRANVSNCAFIGCSTAQVNARKATFTGCNFTEADFTGVGDSFAFSEFNNCNFRRAKGVNEIEQCSFTGDCKFSAGTTFHPSASHQQRSKKAGKK